MSKAAFSPDKVPSVQDVLDYTYVSNGFHQWGVTGGVVLVQTKDLRAALEDAYDANMVEWPSLVDEESVVHAAAT